MLQQRQLGNGLGRHVQLHAGQGGAAYRHRVFVHQEMCLGARPAGIAEVDGGVEAGLVEQEGTCLGVQVHDHFGLAGLETAQARQQPAGGEGRHDSQVQRAAGAVLRHHGQGVLLQGVQPGADLPAVVLSGLGQLYTPPGAPKERHAQVVLQRVDLSADGALGQRQFLGRPREAFVAGRGLEGKQGVGAGDLLAHDGVGGLRLGRTISEFLNRTGYCINVV